MLAEKPWRPELVMRLLAGLLASISLGVMIVAGYEGMAAEAGRPRHAFFSFVIGTFSLHVVGLVLIDVFLRQHQVSWTSGFGFNEKRKGRAILLAVLVAIIVLPIAWSLFKLSAELLGFFKWDVETQAAVKALQTSVGLNQKIMYAFAAILLAPFVEELLFRGILYPAVKQNGGKSFALWGVSILFAATHGSMALILPLTFLAVILSLLYETTNNLLAPILAHALFNAVNYVNIVWGQSS